MSIVYEAISSLCKEKGISIGRMCDEVGISRGILSDLKYGRKETITLKTAQKIADYFSTDVSVAFADVEHRTFNRKEENYRTIYAIQCEATKRVYVGCTRNLEARIRAHFQELRSGRKKQYMGNMKDRAPKDNRSVWQKDYDEYGESSFKIYVLDKDVPIEVSYNTEISWIKYYDSTNPKYGYNHCCYAKKNVLTITDGIPKRMNVKEANNAKTEKDS
jgi:transcriptional regulator with XRE-family HTH domain